MPQALILIIAAMTQEPEKIRKALGDVLYYQIVSKYAHPYKQEKPRKLAFLPDLQDLCFSFRCSKATPFHTWRYNLRLQYFC